MNKILLALSLVCVAGCVAPKSSSNAKVANTATQNTVKHVQLDKYQGKWYEIARLPMYFQRNCASDVTATYGQLKDGSISVTNQCIDKKGKIMTSNGVAEVDTRYPDVNSKLLVSFLPNELQWLPFGKGGYWILALDSDENTADYTHALVGSPSRKYLWILSRTPNMPDTDYQNYLNIAQSQGYDITQLMKTPHNTHVNHK